MRRKIKNDYNPKRNRNLLKFI